MALSSKRMITWSSDEVIDDLLVKFSEMVWLRGSCVITHSWLWFAGIVGGVVLFITQSRHLRGRMFPYFAEACVIFGNDYSYHTLNVCESFGLVVANTSQTASVLGESFGDTQVESVESVGGLGEPSSVVDTTPSPPSVEYSFSSVEYSWQ
ncbi:hypothetical protein IFM89_032105 [Coptis chinensis]|uniref:Uncharacterized protein n=1 Tax=Coptis chinensis TaxID=261450 RepID=A0A835I664_9MAGN|nr:hypothetical protein IFM89_032105 [Coptis chinensis]